MPPFDYSNYDKHDDRDKPVIDARITFKDDETVTITFSNVHVLDVDALFALLGTDKARDRLLLGLARGLAARVMNLNPDAPIGYTITEKDA